MKRTSKIFAILLTVLLIFGVIGIVTLAVDTTPAATDDRKEAISEGKFLFYDSSAGTYTEYANSKFATQVAALKDGDAIVLLSDVHSETYGIAPSAAGTAYIDLNGYRLSAHYSHTSRYYLQPKANTTLYMYSSDENYNSQIFCAATNQDNGKEASMVFINPRYDNTHVYLGDATGAPVFEKNGNTWTLKSKTGKYSGDNLEFYGSTLFSSYISSSNTNPQNSSINLGGGSYYNVQGSGILIMNYSGVDVNVNGSKFFATSGGNFLSFNSAVADANVNVKDTLIYTSGAAINAFYESEANEDNGIKASNTVFENCSFVCQNMISSLKSGTPEFNNCRYANAVYSDGTNELVKTNEKETITIKSSKFYRKVTSTEKTTTTDNVTTTTTVYTGTVLDSSFTVSETTVPVTYIQRGVKDANLVNVTWVTMTETLSEKWYKGDNVYPLSKMLPAPTDICTYDYYPQIKPTAQTGDVTYTIKPNINFTIKANIALYADFTYNLYLPKESADSNLFNWARINSLTSNGSVYETGAQLAVKGGKVQSLEVAKGVFEDHYVLYQNISAFEGDTEYQLVINVDDGFGGTFEHVQKFSIFDYADRVNAGNYTDEAKSLVNYTKTYIKAARNYAADGDTLPYPVATNPDLSEVLGAASFSKKASPSDEIKAVFYGMNVSLDESIKFSFYLKPGFTDTVKFSYPVNTKYTSVEITAADCTPDDTLGEDLLRYDISMRAIDLRGKIVIDISSTPDIEEDYSYRLSNYVYSIKEEPEATRLLIDSLWAYSLATYNYLKIADSDSPTISVNVAGNTVTADSYAIVATDPTGKAAITLRDAILAKTGESLEISDSAVSGKNSIYVSLTDPNVTYDFVAYVSGDDLVINCGFKSFIDSAMLSFVGKNINTKNTDIEFNSDFRDDYYTGNIYYSDFGAVGIDMDAVAALGSKYANIENWYGETLEYIRDSGLLVNDFFNIRNAHIYANKTQRHTVCADDSAFYYIRESLYDTSILTITIQTPTKWGNANFLIDDTFIPGTETKENKYQYKQRSNIINISSNYASFSITNAELLAQIAASGINPETKVIDLNLGYPAMIIPFNSSHNIYRRKGYGSWAGDPMKEVILIDEDGNVSSKTPIMFDYTSIDEIVVYRSDVTPITVEGGIFTTIVPNDETVTYKGSGSYISRGISITRSNATVKNVEHHIIGEYLYNGTPTEGDPAVCPYQGFFSASSAANILIEDCIFQAKRYYRIAGTYDFSGNSVAGITLKGCTQRNFWVDENGRPTSKNADGARLSMLNNICWGLGGTNYCKEMVYEDSTLSRFDAHCGLYNGKIINSTISGLEIIGRGTLLLDNVTWYGASSGAAYNAIISLRADYGCTWTGDIILRNVKAYPYEGTNAYFGTANQYPTALIYHAYANWYFGYECHFPNLTVENLEYYSRNTGKLLTSEEVGPIDFAVKELSKSGNTYSFISEPDLHLDTTKKTNTVFEDVDADKDGYVDGTNIKYDGTANNKGVTDTSSYVNRNKIVPPEYFIIINNRQGYDFTSRFDYYKQNTTFFNNTKIITVAPNEAPDHIKNEDSPITPY